MNHIRFKRNLSVFLGWLSVLAVSGVSCSPRMFFGERTQDPLVSQSQGYRQIPSECSRIGLSNSTLDIQTLKKWVACLNSYGAIEPIAKLIHRIEVEDRVNHRQDLQAIVDFQNQYLLHQPKLIFQLNKTYQALEGSKKLDELLRQFGRFAAHDEFVSAGLTLLKHHYFGPNHQRFLGAFQELSTQVDAQTVVQGLEIGVTLGRARAFNSFQSHFNEEVFKTLTPLVENWMLSSRRSSLGRSRDLGREVIQAIINHELLESLDQVMGVTSTELKKQVNSTTSVVQFLLKNDAHILRDLSALFHALRNHPITCLGGSKEVPDGVMHVIRELSDVHGTDPARYFKRTNKVALMALQPFCEFPSELKRYYPAIEALSDSTEMLPVANLLRTFYRVEKVGLDGELRHPLAELLADSLGDFERIKSITPLLLQLNSLEEKGALWDDLLLVAALPRIEDREDLKNGLKYLIRPVPALQNQSLYDFLSEVFVETDPQDLRAVIWSLRTFFRGEDQFLEPLFKNLRSAFYVNDVHPVIQILHEVMSSAVANERFFDVFFRVSEMPEFRESLKLISEMAQDHRLKELLGAVVSLFHQYGLRGQVEVHSGVEPVFKSEQHQRHDWQASDLEKFSSQYLPPLSPSEKACRSLDFGVDLGDLQHPGFSEQVSHLVSCLNDRQQFDGVENAVRFLQKNKTEDGKDFIQFSIQLIQDLKLTSAQMGYLTDRWLDWMDEGRFSRVLTGLSYWIKPMTEFLIRLSRPLMSVEVRPAFDRLQKYGAEMLRRTEMPLLLGYAQELLEVQPKRLSRMDPGVYDLTQISQWVRQKECGTRSPEVRSMQVVSEYRDSLTGWDLVTDRSGSHPRSEWKFAEFFSEFQSLLKTTDRGVFDSLLRFMGYFSLKPGETPHRDQHYTVEDLIQWLRDRSSDHKLITFYYPGEDRPRVRLVNSLDRLELVLIGADFNAPVLGTNFGLKFLADIAEAWGDEDPRLWPEAIKRKAKKGAKIKTLAEVVHDINQTQSQFERLVGFPALPKCYRVTHPLEQDPEGQGWVGWLPGMDPVKPQMYNIHQVISVLGENVENGGLKVLRDLFFEVYYTRQKGDRFPSSNRDHLKAILKMVRMGIFRQLGRTMKFFSEDDPGLRDLFRTLVEGSTQRAMRDLFELLLVQDPEQRLIRAALEQVFTALEGGSEQELKAVLFYVLANTSSLDLIAPLVKNLSVILQENRSFFIEHADLLQDLFSSESLAKWVQIFYEDQNNEMKKRVAENLREALSDPDRGLDFVRILRAWAEDPDASRSWKEFHYHVKTLLESEEYRRLDLGGLAVEIVRFFEERSETPLAIETARHLRHYLAQRVEDQDFDRFLSLAAREPQGVAQVSQAFEESLRNGNLQEFFEFIRRSIKNPIQN